MGKGCPRSATLVLSPWEGGRTLRGHGLGAGWATRGITPLPSVCLDASLCPLPSAQGDTPLRAAPAAGLPCARWAAASPQPLGMS